MSRKKKHSSRSEPQPSAQAAALTQFKPLLSAEEFRLLLEELQRPLLTAFRTNPLKTNQSPEVGWAQRYGWQLEPVPYCPTGFWVAQAANPVSMTLEHRTGHYYIQDAASMLPVELFDLDELSDPLVLDLAASPGGKTTHISSRLSDHGLIIANDSAADRITALRLVLQTWGSTNIAVTRFPGEKFGRWFPETFDRILLDAPCSMQSLRSTDSHPMRSITSREQANLAQRQASLLAAAIAALKVGGQVVYSTCTLAPSEDEGVLNEILRRFPGAIEIERLEGRLPHPAPALSQTENEVYDPQVTRAARLWPHRFHTSGFFAALIRKTASVDFPQEDAPDRPLSLVGQNPLPYRMLKEILSIFTGNYGLPLEDILQEHKLELWQSAAGIFAVPSRYIRQFGGLPCQLLGLKLAEETPEGFIPAHDWVTRFANRFSSAVITVPDEVLPAWLRGEDLDIPASGGVVILYDAAGRCLGRGRAQNGKIKNLLPRRLI